MCNIVVFDLLQHTLDSFEHRILRELTLPVKLRLKGPNYPVEALITQHRLDLGLDMTPSSRVSSLITHKD
ncbi:hypothetical protein GCM10010459_20520 [Microbacterium schleiferi]